MRTGAKLPVTIEKPTRVRAAGSNEPVLTWVIHRQTFAHVQPLAGRELERAQAVVAEVTHTVELDYHDASDVTPDMRFVVDGHTLNIAAPGIDKDMSHRVLSFACVEQRGN